MEKQEGIIGVARATVGEGSAWLGVLISALSGFNVIASINDIGLYGVIKKINVEYRKLISPVHDVISDLFPIIISPWQIDLLIFYLVLFGLCARLLFSQYAKEILFDQSARKYEKLFVLKAHNTPPPRLRQIILLYPVMVNIIIPFTLSLLLWPIWSFYIFRHLVKEYNKPKPANRLGMPIKEWAQTYRSNEAELRQSIREVEEKEQKTRYSLIVSGIRFYLVPALIILLFAWNVLAV